jgi:hypothetical protein
MAGGGVRGPGSGAVAYGSGLGRRWGGQHGAGSVRAGRAVRGRGQENGAARVGPATGRTPRGRTALGPGGQRRTRQVARVSVAPRLVSNRNDDNGLGAAWGAEAATTY